MKRPTVAFVCTHNACRSQVAQAMAQALAADALIVYSAGTNPANRINPDAARLLASEFGIASDDLRPKALSQIPEPDRKSVV